MDVFTLLATLRRQWRTVVVVMVITVLAAALMFVVAGQPYRMHGSFLVSGGAPGQAAGAQGGGTAVAPSSLDSTVIAEAVQGGEVVEQLPSGATATYEVSVNGDILRVVARDSDRGAVVPTVAGVLEAIESEVESRQQQAEIPEDERVKVETVAVPTDASVQATGTGDEQEFRAAGTVRLLRPGGAQNANPYGQFGYSMRVLEEVLHSQDVRQQIVDAGGDPEIVTATEGGVEVGSSSTASAEDGLGYRLTYSHDDPAPIAYLSVTGSDAQSTAATFATIRQVVSQHLSERQAALGIDEEARAELQPLAVFDEPRPASQGLLRPLIILLGLGGAVAVGLALLRDNIAQGRWRRREQHEVESPSTRGVSVTGARAGEEVARPPSSGGSDARVAEPHPAAPSSKPEPSNSTPSSRR